MWGVWQMDDNGKPNGKTGWWLDHSEFPGSVIAFPTKKMACKVAARLYGFDSYAEAKAKGWVEVRKIGA